MYQGIDFEHQMHVNKKLKISNYSFMCILFTATKLCTCSNLMENHKYVFAHGRMSLIALAETNKNSEYYDLPMSP